MGACKTGAGSLRDVTERPDIAPGDTPEDDEVVFPVGRPGVPGRGAVALAFLGVVVAGVLGGMIGYGLADIMCDDDCGPMLAVGTIVGAALAAAGVGVVAVLGLRAMVEWKRTPPPDAERVGPVEEQVEAPGDDSRGEVSDGHGG